MQVAVIYRKETKELIATLEILENNVVNRVTKVPGIQVLVTKKIENMLYVEKGRWLVNEELILSSK